MRVQAGNQGGAFGGERPGEVDQRTHLETVELRNNFQFTTNAQKREKEVKLNWERLLNAATPAPTLTHIGCTLPVLYSP